MRVRFLLLPTLVVAVAFTGPGPDAPRDPKFATIAGACTPAENPSVQPAQVLMTRADNVEWREPSGRATSWVITPKDAERWPFPSSIGGTPQGPANSGAPAAGAAAGVYSYNVTITCGDGSTQVIDPDIIIGEN